MSISAGDAGCTTGLSGALYTQLNGDSAVGLVSGSAAAKAFCYELGVAIATVCNAGFGAGGNPAFQDEGVSVGSAATLNFVGAGVTCSVAASIATITIPGGGGSTNFVDAEIPSGTVNGSNVTFTLAHTPTAGSLHFYLNGVRLRPTTDYTLAGATITMVAAPQTGDWLYADYRY